MSAHDLEHRFETGEHARLDLDLDFGVVELTAIHTTTTRVVVRPAIADRRQDQELAQSTRVDHTGGVVSIRAHHSNRLASLFRPGGVALLVEAPIGTDVTADVGYAAVVAAGCWGHLRIRSSYGDVRVDEADEADIASSGGSVAVGTARRAATLSNSYGPIRLTEAAGRCALRNSSGDIIVSTCTGELHVRSAYGQVLIDAAESGAVGVVTSHGAIDLGIAPGTAVRLDVHTKDGMLANALTPLGDPSAAARRLEVKARSGGGDIVIRRSPRPRG